MGLSIFHSDRLADLTERLPRLVEAVLLLLMVLLLTDLFWPTGNASLVSEANGNAKATPANERIEVAIQPIIDAKLFGDVQKAPVQAARPKVAVKSSRNIKLQGTIMAGERSAAMLQVQPGAKVEYFKVGQAVLPGVILKEVETSRVVLESAGKLEIVELEWKKVPGSR